MNVRTSNNLLVGFVTQYRVLCRFRKLATCKTWLVTPKVTKEPNTPVPLACVKPSLTLKRVSVCRLAQVCLHQEQNIKRTGGEPTQFSGSKQPLRCVVTVGLFSSRNRRALCFTLLNSLWPWSPKPNVYCTVCFVGAGGVWKLTWVTRFSSRSGTS